MSDRARIGAVLGLYLLFGLGYSLLMPVWEAPDERAHYGYALRLARTGERPSIEDNYEAFQPPLYYRIAALPLVWIDAIRPEWVRTVSPGTLPPIEGRPRYDWNSENTVFLPGPLVLRWLGLVFGGMTLLFVYGGVRRIFPKEPALALGSVALIGGIPQFIHITASVNNDVLAILAGGLLFLGLAEICRCESFSLSWIWIAVAALLFPVVTKLTVLPLALAVLLALMSQTRRIRPDLAVRYLFVAAGLSIVVFLILLAAAPGVVDEFIRELAFRLFSFRPGIWDGTAQLFVLQLVLNFWGKVGWLTVGIPSLLAAALTVLAGAGIGFALRSLYFSGEEAVFTPAQRRFLAFSLIAIGAAGLMLFRNFLTTPQLQGRFLFPTLGPIALWIVFGWRRLLAERERFLVPVIVGMLFLLNIHLWITGVIPVYYQPFLDH
jgi:hypothetical protein